MKQQFPEFDSFEIKLFRKLFSLASTKKAISKPNPVTAAAVVKERNIVSMGSHNKFGTPHAETIAIEAAGDKANGAKLYVNLEPCTHWGNNPPCTDFIIKSGIKEVVYSIRDPNPEVKRQPAKKILEQAGIKVREGVLKEEALVLNEVFFKNQFLKKTFVIAKIGMSLDGKIALSNGESKYITGEKSRKIVHQYRTEADAVIVGVGTIIKDNPSLNIRFGFEGKYRNPIKIILDTQGKTPQNAKIFKENRDTKIIIATTKETIKKNKLSHLKNIAEIWEIPVKNGWLSWQELLQKAYEQNIFSVLIEGGQKVFTSALESKVIDKMKFFVAPKIIASQNAFNPFAGKDFTSLEQVYNLKDIKIKKIDQDILITGYLNHPAGWFTL